MAIDELAAEVVRAASRWEGGSPDRGAKASAGPSGFRLETGDDRFKLRIGGVVQTRAAASFGADDPGPGDDGSDTSLGFSNARVRLDLRGQVYDPRLTFRVLSQASSSGAFSAVDVYTNFEPAEGVALRAGQMKIPFDREFSVSGTRQLAVERSLVSRLFSLRRTQGVQLRLTGERARLFGMVSDGRAAINTASFNDREADVALSVRGEARLGDASWRQFGDHAGSPGSETGVLLGVGGHWQQDGDGGFGSPRDGGFAMYQYTLDATFEGDGVSALVAVTGRVLDQADTSPHDLGVVVQGGLFVTEEIEVFGRYALIVPDRDREQGREFDAITAGLNWYPLGFTHAFKLTAEATLYPRGQAGSSSVARAPDSGLSLLPDESGSQVGLLAQLQILF